jgi:hypothetical protein
VERGTSYEYVAYVREHSFEYNQYSDLECEFVPRYVVHVPEQPGGRKRLHREYAWDREPVEYIAHVRELSAVQSDIFLHEYEPRHEHVLFVQQYFWR